MHWNIFKIEYIGFIFKSIFIFWKQDVDVLLMSCNANFVQKTSIVKKTTTTHTHTQKKNHADLLSDWDASILWRGSQGQIKQPVRVRNILLHSCSEFMVPFGVDDCTSNTATDSQHSSSNYFCRTESRQHRTIMRREQKVNSKLNSRPLLQLLKLLIITIIIVVPDNPGKAVKKKKTKVYKFIRMFRSSKLSVNVSPLLYFLWLHF